MRLAVIAAWALVVVAALIPLLRRPLGAPRALDELVKDPVCGTYIVRSRAVSRESADGPRYFCSTDCARRYAGA